MARLPRFTILGIPQHIIQRGNNREACFYTDEDYGRYIDDLADAADKNQAHIHAYVLMTNLVHLLVTPLHEHSITHMMQDLGVNMYAILIIHIKEPERYGKDALKPV